MQMHLRYPVPHSYLISLSVNKKFCVGEYADKNGACFATTTLIF